MKKTIEFMLNGEAVSLSVLPSRSLLSVLRQDLELTGSKYGCGKGLCGACTVLVDGNTMRSCRVSIESVAGKKVLTIEGLAPAGDLHPLQQAFVEEDALQCGYCTPGMIMQAYGVLLKDPQITREEVIRRMEGNLCRCGAHKRILQAVEKAAAVMREGR
ncbi:MAG: (2Fe-2S)-binding protein [Acidobacteriota bacterium]|nr:MAG: (2Fe-2S)-binding protein [Acidobacteriota bacterium]